MTLPEESRVKRLIANYLKRIHTMSPSIEHMLKQYNRHFFALFSLYTMVTSKGHGLQQLDPPRQAIDLESFSSRLLNLGVKRTLNKDNDSPPFPHIYII